MELAMRTGGGAAHPIRKAKAATRGMSLFIGIGIKNVQNELYSRSYKDGFT